MRIRISKCTCVSVPQKANASISSTLNSLVIFLSPYPAQEMYESSAHGRALQFFLLQVYLETNTVANCVDGNMLENTNVWFYDRQFLHRNSHHSCMAFRFFFWCHTFKTTWPVVSFFSPIATISRYPVVLAGTLIRSFCSRISFFAVLSIEGKVQTNRNPGTVPTQHTDRILLSGYSSWQKEKEKKKSKPFCTHKMVSEW